MQHCKEAVMEFVQQLTRFPRPNNLWENYQTLLAQFASEDELDEAIWLSGYQEYYCSWLEERSKSMAQKQEPDTKPNLGPFQWYDFQFDERLGIELPIVYQEWESIPKTIREQIIFRWEDIRGRIPDRIKALDDQLEKIQQKINQEQDWERVCDYFTESHSIATIINELNIWYRKQQEV